MINGLQSMSLNGAHLPPRGSTLNNLRKRKMILSVQRGTHPFAEIVLYSCYDYAKLNE